MKEISGKKIAIDISIYLYKFAADNTLIENIYLMLSIFRYYQIIPVFVFDGKPPDEKKQVLEKRKNDKIEAKKEFQKLKKQLETDHDLDHDEKQELSITMDLLKKKFIYIKKEQIDQVKELMRAFGATYFDASGEADELCALLAIKKKVWACMSEDMDLFVYGCPRVLRYFSLLKHNVVIYNTKRMLEELGLLEKEFRQICVLSGTDYNIYEKNGLDLYGTLKLFKKYYKTKTSTKENVLDFYQWILENTTYILDFPFVQKIDDLFNLREKKDKSGDIIFFEKMKVTNGSYVKKDIQKILSEDGFIFA
uniref:XPG N-terminal domain-containing protein n=1 Tax=viral metagenome TaxID=1070528 RepID=A0A6C0BBV9_9ZZZZ